MLPRLLPLLLVVHLALPGTIGSIKNAFLPSGGIVAQETSAERCGRSTTGAGHRRVEPRPEGVVADADVRPGRRHARQRLPGPEVQRAHHRRPVAQSLLELGVVGVVALLWFFTASIRRLGRLARRDDSDDGWLLAALASA